MSIVDESAMSASDRVKVNSISVLDSVSVSLLTFLSHAVFDFSKHDSFFTISSHPGGTLLSTETPPCSFVGRIGLFPV